VGLPVTLPVYINPGIHEEIYDEAVIRETTDNMETGISVGGRIVNTVRQTRQ